MKLKHLGILDSDTLPKHEDMKARFKKNSKLAQEMRNYAWEWFHDYAHCRSYYVKYRRHGQYNGKKPRKREYIRRSRQFREQAREELIQQYKNEMEEI